MAAPLLFMVLRKKIWCRYLVYIKNLYLCILKQIYNSYYIRYIHYPHHVHYHR